MFDISEEASMNDKEFEYLECEKRHVFFLLMFVGGFLGAFTYSIRGGIFCNAQTANFVLMGMAIGNQQWSKTIHYLIPMIAYLFGTILSEALPSPIKKKEIIRWDTLLIGIEMIVILILGFLPETAPFQISQIAINIIMAMQYNTFRQARGIPMATTFCTNHIRQVGVHLYKTIHHHNDKQFLMRFIIHLGMLLTFVAGAVISTAACRVFLGKAIWITLIPLGILLVQLLRADLINEKEFFHVTPKGH